MSEPSKSKSLRVLRWALFNACLWFIAWTAVEGNVGAGYLLVFLSYLELIGSLGSNTEEGRARIRKEGRSVPPKLNEACDVARVCFVIYHGWIHIGIILFIAAVFEALATRESLNLNQSAAP